MQRSLDAKDVAPAAARKAVIMQPVTTLALVRSAHTQWDTLRAELATQADVRIVGDIRPTQPLCALAGRHPVVILATADLAARPPVPLVRDLRALSPESKIILLGDTAMLDGTALITLHDQGIRGYLVWEEVHSGTIQRALALVAKDDVLVASPVVLVTLRAALERRRGVRAEGLTLTPEQRVTWTRPLGEPSVPLTQREREVAELVADGYTNAEIGERLYIREDTAAKHVQSLLHKAGVPSRRAFSRAYRGEEIEEPDEQGRPDMADNEGLSVNNGA